MDLIIDISIRAAAVYLFMLIAIRLSGKKEISQMGITDLVLILLISNAVQNAMVGPDTSLLGGLIAAGVLFIINYLFKLIQFRFPRFASIIEGDEVMLIYKGNVIEEALKREKITLRELEAVGREHGVESISSIELAVLEANGSISIVSKNLTGQSFHKRSKGAHAKFKRTP